MGFIDTMRGEGFAVETICAALREQGVAVAARTYRAWKSPTRVLAARTLTDAVVVDTMRGLRTDAEGKATPESLYGRRKMTALLRRGGLAVAHCTVDRLMRDQAMNGVRRGRAHRTTILGKDGVRAGDLLGRDFSALAPNRVWVADFTYVRTWAGFVYVAFVVDVFAQRIVGWHAMTTKPADLVLIPLRMAAWSRGQQGHPITRGDLIHHSDAGSVHRDPLHRTPHPRGHRRLDRHRRRRLRQRPDGVHHRTVQDRGHPPRPLPHRPAEEPRRRRVHDHGLGRLVQPPAPALHPRHAHPRRS